MNNLYSFLKLFLILIVLASCSSSKQGLIPYGKNEKFGYKNIYGKVVVKPKFKGVGWGNLNDYKEAMGSNGKWGIINREGKFVVKPLYDEISAYSLYFKKLIEVKSNGKCGFINLGGEVIIPLIYDDAWSFQNGLAKVKLNEKWGYIDTIGHIEIPIEYDDFHYHWSEGMVGAKKDGKWGFLDRNNQMRIPFDYYDVSPFSEGLANAALSYGQWGYIDSTNTPIIPFEYEGYGGDNSDFNHGIAAVTLNNRSGYINKKGEVVVPLIYTYIHEFCKGYAYVVAEPLQSDNCDNEYINGYIDSVGNQYVLRNKGYGYYKEGDWSVTEAPKEIPDYSHLLDENIDNPEYIKYHQTIYYEEPSDSLPNPFLSYLSDTSSMALDTSPYFEKNYSFYSPIDYVYSELYYELLYKEPEQFITQKSWTLEKLLSLSLNALTNEPQSYPDLCNLNQICIGYGMLLSCGNYTSDFAAPEEGYKKFKKETIYKIISTENLRNITWNWISPFIQKAFNTMNPIVKKTYKEIALYLKNYINNYNIAKVKAHLKNNERQFAYKNPDGVEDPNRKLSAFIDRLIIVHKVLKLEDAKRWINKIADEVAEW